MASVGLVIFTFTFVITTVYADYDCICNYNIEISVYDKPMISDVVIGYLYEFDCKPNAPVSSASSSLFHAILYEHQVGYVENNAQVERQTCEGDIPDSDKLTSTTSAYSEITSPLSTSPQTKVVVTTVSNTKPITTSLPASSTGSLNLSTMSSVAKTTDLRTSPTGTDSSSPGLASTVGTKTTSASMTSTLTSEPAVVTTTHIISHPTTHRNPHLHLANVSGTQLAYIGMGYNLISGNYPNVTGTKRILQLTETGGKVNEANLTTHPGPCVVNKTKTLVHGSLSLQQQIYSFVHLKGNHPAALLNAGFLDSTAFRRDRNQLESGQTIYEDDVSFCTNSTATYNTDQVAEKHFSVTEEFALDICNLPLVVDDTYMQTYFKFLDEWGTSVILAADFGAREATRTSSSLSRFLLDIKSQNEALFSHSGPVDGYSSSWELDKHGYLTSGVSYTKTSTTTNTIRQELVGISVSPIFDFVDWLYFSGMERLGSGGKCSHTLHKDDIAAVAGNIARALGQYPAHFNVNQPMLKDAPLKIPVTWPKGKYGLMKTAHGCPGSNVGWLSGYRFQDTENNNLFSFEIERYLAGFFQKNDIQTEFCVKINSTVSPYDSDWPKGTYCILRKQNCPAGFTDGYIQWDDFSIRGVDRKCGVLPDGIYDLNTKIYYCCRNDGLPSKEITLPIGRPFVLVQYGLHCQKVYGMEDRSIYIYWDDANLLNSDLVGGMHPHDDGGPRNHRLHYCYYQHTNAINIVG